MLKSSLISVKFDCCFAVVNDSIKYGLNCSVASVACCTSEESLQSFNLFSLNKETYSQQDSHYEIQRAVIKYHKLLRFSVVFILQKPRHFSEGDPPKGSGTKV